MEGLPTSARPSRRRLLAVLTLTGVVAAAAISFGRAKLEEVSGALLIAIALRDVFITVLYARIRIGFLSTAVGWATSSAFLWVARRAGARRGIIMAFCGPTVLALHIAVWAFTLSLGAGLMLHPNLGTGVRSQSGPTPTDFGSALFAGGISMSIGGSSELVPQTTSLRLLYLANALVGMSVVSLSLTYLMQVYSALLRRNAFALKLHFLSGESGDAAELLAGLGPEGRFDTSTSTLADLGGEAANLQESHHFYPLLVYFRFGDPLYSVSRMSLLTLDVVTLIKSALDDEKYRWVKESGSIEAFWRGADGLVDTLVGAFSRRREVASEPGGPSAKALALWRQRYFAALRRLRQAGIQTTADEEAGAELYAALRARWDPPIGRLSPLLGFTPEEIDPVGGHPEVTERRTPFRNRRHSMA
jgi:hypothetical protein